ncbi:hypothetical protein TNCV_3667931 [Trichonephila clavipes]|nr:hypothetical protein TNCV_3667931 [Trichonephila clavipes]
MADFDICNVILYQCLNLINICRLDGLEVAFPPRKSKVWGSIPAVVDRFSYRLVVIVADLKRELPQELAIFEPRLITRGLNRHLLELESWFSRWKIALNVAKTEIPVTNRRAPLAVRPLEALAPGRDDGTPPGTE